MSSFDGCISPADLTVVAGQLHRSARDITGVAVRCPFGYPAVIESSPTLGEAPNPTLLYLTCPAMVTAVSRAEAAGGVRRFRAWARTDQEAHQTLEEITSWYKRRRASLAGGQSFQTRPDAGIGGPEEPGTASCLHAYGAALLAVMSGWLRDGSVDRSVEHECLEGPGAAVHPVETTNPGAVREAESTALAMTGESEAALDSLAIGGKAVLEVSVGAETVSSDTRSICAAQRIWALFLPPVEEIWCKDRVCARLGP